MNGIPFFRSSNTVRHAVYSVLRKISLHACIEDKTAMHIRCIKISTFLHHFVASGKMMQKRCIKKAKAAQRAGERNIVIKSIMQSREAWR
jgi:hypothetical protein